ncbi:MAG: hypothetical protein CL610_06400 [Anaerolineaceae bacterium]|nr:hypothetical protein [Anaerolineaceae bacterium]
MPLQRFINHRSPNQNGVYRISFPKAEELCRALESYVGDSFRIQKDSVDSLRITTCPAGFRLTWQYDQSRQTLRRLLQNADGYLGDGWVYLDRSVWQINSDLPREVIKWLNKPEISGIDIFRFCNKIKPQLEHGHFACDLEIESDFQARLNIVKMLKQSMDVQVSTNKPYLASALQEIRDDTDNLISGNTILPGWRQKLPGQLLPLTRSGAVERLQGNELLSFIQDDLTPNARNLDVDMSVVQNTYRILDAALCSVKFKLEQGFEHGVGYYQAVPCLSVDSDLIPLSVLDRKIESGARFIRLDDSWLEFNQQFRSYYASWKQKSINPIRLTPQEVMGSYLNRLSRMGLQPPAIKVENAKDEREQAHLLVDTMQKHGLPVGFSGLQQEAGDLFAEVCSSLLTQYHRTKILWLLPRRKLSGAASSLKQAKVPYKTDGSRLEGQVLIASPDVPLPDVQWTVVIFTDVDAIVSGERQSKGYSALRRNWSVCTFSREDWDRDILRAQRMLRVLGLDSADLEIFKQLCVGNFSKQTDGFLSRLASPFKKILVNDDTDSPPGRAVAIPPRHEPYVPRSKEAAKDVFRPTFTVSTSLTSPKSRFLEQARRYATQTEQVAQSVPFMQYWPTYESMSNVQRKWYFYWRSRIRSGDYVPTDLSYMFLHIYEIIHLVGFNNPQAAFDYLVNFWKQFRSVQPKLDNYLIDWLADFIVVYKLPQAPLTWYAHAAAQGGKLGDENLALDAWLSTNAQMIAIPDTVLNLISDYRFSKSKFYQQENNGGFVERELRNGLHVIDEHLQRTHGKTFFDYYRPSQSQYVRRQPFASAVYEGPRETITIAQTPRWTDAAVMKSSVTSILKYTENRLRRQKNFRGTLRGIELPQDWIIVLDTAFPLEDAATGEQVIAPAYEPIVIDLEKAEELTIISDKVQARLQTDDESDAIPIDEPQVESTIGAPWEVPDQQLSTKRPADTPAHLLTELQEVANIIATDKVAIKLLSHLQAQQWEIAQDIAQAILDGEFLNVVLDRINERAIEQLADQLVVIEGNNIVVTEDYRDEIEHLLANPVPIASGVAPSEQPLYEDLDPTWTNFVNKMQAHHWEALNALLVGEDVTARLDGIARSAYITSNLLVDQINEFALDSIGDIVIEAGDPPHIEEEDWESLRQIMAWALEHIIREQ